MVRFMQFPLGMIFFWLGMMVTVYIQ